MHLCVLEWVISQWGSGVRLHAHLHHTHKLQAFSTAPTHLCPQLVPQPRVVPPDASLRIERGRQRPPHPLRGWSREAEAADCMPATVAYCFATRMPSNPQLANARVLCAPPTHLPGIAS